MILYDKTIFEILSAQFRNTQSVEFKKIYTRSSVTENKDPELEVINL